MVSSPTLKMLKFRSRGPAKHVPILQVQFDWHNVLRGCHFAKHGNF